MRPAASLLLFVVIVLRVSASDDQAWSYVPAARDARFLEGFAVPGMPSEGVVRLVGANPPDKLRQDLPRHVFAVEISEPPDERVDAPRAVEAAEPPIPADARWPDAHDRITMDFQDRGKSSKDPALRNPWEERILPKNTGTDTVFSCGGIIAGGGGGPVAILNGRIVRRGDTLGEFSVAAVLENGLMLERSGTYIVIPRGRRTTVTTADR